MSAAKVSPSQAVQDLAVDATSKIRQVLGLNELTPAELKRLSAAVAVAAAEEIARDAMFAQKIRRLFEDMTPSRRAKSPKGTPSPQASPRQKKTMDEILANDGLTPITDHIDHKYDPSAPPDPKFLLQLYGSAQLYKALDRFSTEALRRTIAVMVKEQPGLAKPKAKATKEEIIEFIIAHTRLNGAR
jgi:hypothetical protein